MDYALFLAGLGFLLAGLGASCLAGGGRRAFPWRRLALFALAMGLAEWSRLAGLSLGNPWGLAELHFALRCGAFALLLECGRAGAGGRPGRWLLLALLAPVLLLALVRSPMAETALWLGPGLFGALWTGFALARSEGSAGPVRGPMAQAGSFFWLAPALLLSAPRLLWNLEASPLPALLRAGPALLLAWALWHQTRIRQEEGCLQGSRAGLFQDRSLLVGLVLVLLVGWGGTSMVERAAQEEKRDSLLGKARIAAASLDLELVAALAGEPEDRERAAYRGMKGRLERLRRASDGCRFAYLLADKGGKAVFLVDSEPAESPDCSPPGQIYTQASPELLGAFEKGLPFVEGPLPDAWGVWVSALIPLVDQPSGEVIAILGLDRDAGDWGRSIASHTMPAILVVLLLVVLLLASYRDRLAAHDFAVRIAASENRYRGLVECSPYCVQLFDGNGCYISVNRNGIDSLGWAEEELLGRPFAESWPEPARPSVLEAVARVLAGSDASFQADYVRPDGGSITWQMVLSPVPCAHGEVHNFVAIGMDITESTRAKERLRESEERFRSICSAALDAIIMMDPEGRITVWNEAAVLLFGHTREEALGKDLHQLIAPGRFLERCDAGLDRFRESGQGQALGRIMELTARRKDGSEFPVDLSLSPVRIQDSWHAVGMIRDTTERKQFEKELYAAKEAMEAANVDLHREMERANRMAAQAESANLAKSRFLANMSHEIRTPMNGVLGMTRLLLDTDLDPEQRDWAQMALSSAESLLALLDDILDLSKIEAGKLEFESREFDVRALAWEVVSCGALAAEAKGLSLSFLVDRNVPFALRGDPGRIRQVLCNLVGNAIKFTDHGRVVLRVSLRSGDGNRALMGFSVQDTGIGIREQDQTRLFEAFSQVDSSTTRKHGGTGLGLSISRNLVRRMGGELSVASTPGEGSCFSFALPLRVAAGSVAPDPDLSGLEILVAGSDRIRRGAIVELLAARGCAPGEAGSREELLQWVRTCAGTAQRIVLLEIEFVEGSLEPGPNGALDLAGARLVLVHGLSGRHGREDLWGRPFDAFLARPAKPAQLLEAIVRLGGPKPAPFGTDPEKPAEAQKARALRILLAEDNPVNQMVASRLLLKMGHQVEVVAGGQVALEALRARSFDIVFMDIQMPGMDGFEATRRIRSNDFPAHVRCIPIVAMTAHALKGDRERCLEAGMDDHLPKPIRPEGLASVLERLVVLRSEPAVL